MTEQEYQARLPEFRATITFYFQQELGHGPNDDQMTAYLAWCKAGATGEEMQAQLHREPEAAAFRERPSAPAPSAVPAIRTLGFDFIDNNGQRMVLSGQDAFRDYDIWLEQGEAGLESLMIEFTQLKFQTRRIFLQGAIQENTVMDLWPSREPQWLNQLRPFVQFQNAHGCIPLLTLGIDNQVIKSDVVALAGEVHAACHGLAYLFSGGNEWQKNGFDPQAYPNPGPGILWSRGSGTADSVTPANGASATEFHQRTDPVGMLDAVASVKFMREHGEHMLWMDEPRGYAEVERGDRRSADPMHAWIFARLYSTLWALAIFHCDAGQRGQTFGPVQRACAEAWQRGMRL